MGAAKRPPTSGHRCGGRLLPVRGEVVKRNLAALAAWRSSGHLHLPALLIDRHARDLVHGWRRLGLLRRAEAQVREDLLDGYLVVEVGNDLELPPALATRERVGIEDLRDEARPTRGTANGPTRTLILSFRRSGAPFASKARTSFSWAKGICRPYATRRISPAMRVLIVTITCSRSCSVIVIGVPAGNIFRSWLALTVTVPGVGGVKGVLVIS